MNALRIALKIVLPILVLAVGVGVFLGLKSMRSTPPKKPAVEVAQPVQIIAPETVRGPVTVEALGTLVPARQVALQAEVSGRIEEVGDGFVAGGRVETDDLLVQVDRRDYWLRIKQAQASVKRAEVALRQEESRKVVAEREWSLVGDKAGGSARGKALALREPQIDGARAELAGARSALDQARLAYQRTTVKAPFNAVVRTESVDIGQIAGPGAPLGTLIGSDAWWVQVSLPASELRWIDVPGSEAAIAQHLGDGRMIERSGTVLRQLPDVDPSGLMARVLVEVPDPLSLADPEAGSLLLGATVDVSIAGRRLDDALALPREALRADDTVWRVGPETTLIIDPVEVVRRERERVLIRGIAPDAKVVRSRIKAPIPGMKLAPADDPAPTNGGQASNAGARADKVARTAADDTPADPAAAKAPETTR